MPKVGSFLGLGPHQFFPMTSDDRFQTFVLLLAIIFLMGFMVGRCSGIWI